MDVPSETWEGEGAKLTCTFTTPSDEYWYLRWYKGSDPKTQVYLYEQSPNKGTGRAFNDLAGRCVGQMNSNKNVHILYINATHVGDEDTYTCKVVNQLALNSKKLTVNGEYSNTLNIAFHRCFLPQKMLRLKDFSVYKYLSTEV